MKLYCVFESDWEGNFLNSIHTVEELAQETVDALNNKHKRIAGSFFYEEWEADDARTPTPENT